MRDDRSFSQEWPNVGLLLTNKGTLGVTLRGVRTGLSNRVEARGPGMTERHSDERSLAKFALVGRRRICKCDRNMITTAGIIGKCF